MVDESVEAVDEKPSSDVALATGFRVLGALVGLACGAAAATWTHPTGRSC